MFSTCCAVCCVHFFVRCCCRRGRRRWLRRWWCALGPFDVCSTRAPPPPPPPGPSKKPAKKQETLQKKQKKETPRNLPKEKNKKKDKIHDPVAAVAVAAVAVVVFLPPSHSLSISVCLSLLPLSSFLSLCSLRLPSPTTHLPPRPSFPSLVLPLAAGSPASCPYRQSSPRRSVVCFFILRSPRRLFCQRPVFSAVRRRYPLVIVSNDRRVPWTLPPLAPSFGDLCRSLRAIGFLSVARIF